MAIRASDLIGTELTEQDEAFIQLWERWIDARLLKLRTSNRIPERGQTIKLFLRSKDKMPLPAHIIPELLARYVDAGWHVDYEEKACGKAGSIKLRYIFLTVPIPKTLAAAPPPPKPQQGRAPENPRSGYVYLLKAENGLFKIGRSKSPKFRISEITKAVAPFEIREIHKAWYPDCYAVEAALHKRFAAKRKRGEWFKLTADEAREVIEHAFAAI